MDFSLKDLGSVLLQSIPLCYFCYIYLNNFKVGGSVHWQNASLLPPLLAMAAALILIFTKVTMTMIMVPCVNFDLSRISGGNGDYDFAK